MKPSQVVRIRIILGAVCFAALILIGKLYMVQVVRGAEYKERASRQYTRPGESLFDRGTIFLELKDGALVAGATLQGGFTVAMKPPLVKDPVDAYARLSKHIEVTSDDFYAKAIKKDDPYEEIAKRVAPPAALQIDMLQIPGIAIYKDRWRLYPGDEVAAHALGTVGYSGDNFGGLFGLESYYNDVLSRNDDRLYVNFFAEIFSNVGRIVRREEGKGDIVTALEPTVQAFVEKEIEKIHTKWSSRRTGAIIIDPKTGSIYAMALLPSFNPNSFQHEDPIVFRNSLVEDVYEMGSIIKPLTVAAGIDSGAITPQSTYVDQGFLVLNGSRISNFDGKGRGKVSMQEVLSQSLNTGVAHIVKEMGREQFREYMLRLGLGEETGIDLPGEAHGLISNLDSTRDIEHATASYGQGIAMTPIVTVRALSSLANGGLLPTPHLVERIEYKSGLSSKRNYGEGERVFKKETVEDVTRMLVEVVDKALLDGAIKMDRYSVAAKTGTAQIADPGGGGYYKDRFLHSFFGYFPAYNPRFLIFLYTVEPKGVTYASHTLTTPFHSITKFLINYYNIPPDR